MFFHHYKTMREACWKGTSEDYLRWYLQQPVESTAAANGKQNCTEELAATLNAGLEISWITHQRPYYNVYPIAIELCAKTSLNMKWGDITFPTRCLLLRFPAGCEPLKMSSALVRVPSDAKWSTPISYHKSRKQIADLSPGFPILANMQTIDDSGGWWAYAASCELREEVISDSLGVSENGLQKEGASWLFTDKSNFLVRLLAFIGLLARGTDLVTPAILASDREEYDNTSDEARKRWLEERARKRSGYSFDVGRKLELERAIAPHWRAPHLALFHTGPGRKTPVLRVRSGCVVIPREMSSVPTGFLGEETESERQSQQQRQAVFRTAIPKRLRFRVLRRDGYRCQLCGMTAGDGITLQVDHRVAVANGGSTDESNLWTLCQPCNSGKSDMHLHQGQHNLTPVQR
jgi:hypothetical protein